MPALRHPAAVLVALGEAIALDQEHVVEVIREHARRQEPGDTAADDDRASTVEAIPPSPFVAPFDRSATGRVWFIASGSKIVARRNSSNAGRSCLKVGAN